jgi:hypothetical protein
VSGLRCFAQAIASATFEIPYPAGRQRIRDQIKAALVFARACFVNVLWIGHPATLRQTTF